MAHLDVGAQSTGATKKKAVDADIPLVPFIDLLLCCIMFLLVTAAWTQMSRLTADQRTPTPDGLATDDRPEQVKLVLLLGEQGYVLGSTAGDRTEIPKRNGRYDVAALAERLQVQRAVERERREVVVAPDDGVAYGDIVGAMDALVGAGYAGVSVGDAAL